MQRRVSPRLRVVTSTVLGIAVAGAALAQQSSSSQVRQSSPSTSLAQTVGTPAADRSQASGVAIPQHIQNVRRALSGMLVAIDPETGALRAPDAAEVEALTGAATAARFAAPEPIDLPGGGAAILTSPASIDLLSATRQADGTVSFTCTHGLDAASKTFAADHRQPSKEVRNDR